MLFKPFMVFYLHVVKAISLGSIANSINSNNSFNFGPDNLGDACGPGSTLIRLQALRSLAGIRYDPYRGVAYKQKRGELFSNPPRYI